MTPEKTEQVFAALRDAATEASIESRRREDSTAERIERETGIARSTIYRQLKKLENAGRVHIVAWTDARPAAPVYATGPGKNAPQPAKKTPEEAAQKQRERRLADKARLERDPGYVPPTPARALAKVDAFIARVCKGERQSWLSALEGA